MKNVTLVLSDGTKFHGKSFGYEQPVSGEVVFNTATHLMLAKFLHSRTLCLAIMEFHPLLLKRMGCRLSWKVIKFTCLQWFVPITVSSIATGMA